MHLGGLVLNRMGGLPINRMETDCRIITLLLQDEYRTASLRSMAVRRGIIRTILRRWPVPRSDQLRYLFVP